MELVDPHRLGDVLDRLRADVVEREIELALDLIEHRAGNAHAARRRERLEPGGDVHAIAEDVVVLDDHVAHVDADAKLDSLVARTVGVVRDDRGLDVERVAHGVDGAGKLDQRAVAGGLDDAPAIRRDLGVQQFAAQRPQPRQGAGLVDAHHG